MTTGAVPELDATIGLQIFDAAPVGMALVSKEVRILRANPTFCRFLGYSEQELRGMTIRQITHPDDWPASAGVIRRLWSKGAKDMRPVEKRFLRKSGEVVWGHVHARLMRDPRGRPLFSIAQVIDITERKLTEEALRMSEERFRIALGGTPTTVFSQDRNFRYTWVYNPSPGFQRGSVLGQRDCDIFEPRDAKVFMGIKRRVMKTGVGRRDEVVTHLNGRVTIHDMTTEPLRDGQGRIVGVMCAAFDITGRKRAEVALRNARDELEQKVRERTAKLRALAAELNRVEEQERHRIAQILHDDLQQIVTGARLMLNQLKQGKVPERERRRIPENIDACLEKAQQVMRSLCMDLRPPVLHDAGVGAALRWLKADMRERFGLTVDVAVDPAVEAMPASLRPFGFQAVRELLHNVVKHAGVKRARVRLKRTADQFQIEVMDRGVGFEPEQIGPANFGLFSLRERADDMGGRMTVQSAPGKGTRVRLTLPGS